MAETNGKDVLIKILISVLLALIMIGVGSIWSTGSKTAEDVENIKADIVAIKLGLKAIEGSTSGMSESIVRLRTRLDKVEDKLP